MEERLTEVLGTRVSIDKRENGGKIMIDFFSSEDLKHILDLIKSNQSKSPTEMLDRHIAENPIPPVNKFVTQHNGVLDEDLKDDRTPEQIKDAEKTDVDEDLYSVKNFSI
jgi:hypothetical protein